MLSSSRFPNSASRIQAVECGTDLVTAQPLLNKSLVFTLDERTSRTRNLQMTLDLLESIKGLEATRESSAIGFDLKALTHVPVPLFSTMVNFSAGCDVRQPITLLNVAVGHLPSSPVHPLEGKLINVHRQKTPFPPDFSAAPLIFDGISFDDAINGLFCSMRANTTWNSGKDFDTNEVLPLRVAAIKVSAEQSIFLKSNSPTLDAQIGELLVNNLVGVLSQLGEGHKVTSVTIDLDSTTYLGEEGAAKLFAISKLCRQRGLALNLIGLEADVLRRLRVLNFHTVALCTEKFR